MHDTRVKTLIISILSVLLGFAINTSVKADFICGDANSDLSVDVSDAVYLINYSFAGGPAPNPLEAGDPNCDQLVDVSDAVYLINYAFAGGADLCDPDGDSSPDCGYITITYPIVDTDQEKCYDSLQEISPPNPGDPFYGQDAQVDGNQMSYTDNGDSTITDNVTGLIWTKSCDLDGDGDIDIDDKLTFDEALNYPDNLNAQIFAGYDDWRLPSMKELYSLMNFSGSDPAGPNPSDLEPFIDTEYFDFSYGDESAGERLIDAQFWSTALYVDFVFDGQEATFGLNLADGRIKGYPTTKLNYVYFVRGNPEYGVNDFTDNGDGTIIDNATGLMWSKDDSGEGVNTGPRSGMTWEEAFDYVQQKNDENHLGHNDWRLPNAKELHSLVDYSQAPGITGTAAIDSVFNITQITNEDGQPDYPWFWSSTTHARSDGNGSSAVYICFGRALGYEMGDWLDVHGAGAQRSDRKYADFSGYAYINDGYYFAMSPQGDAIRIYNYVRLVRDAK